ncbi:hypothetical protein ACHAWF_016466, partial [Thalassiosira exigua]
VQNRSGLRIGAELTEARRFCDYFGVGAAIALIAWNILVEHEVLPKEGLIIHMLWALHFMKVYPKQDSGEAAAGGSRAGRLSQRHGGNISGLLFMPCLRWRSMWKRHLVVYNDCNLAVDCLDMRVMNLGPDFASFKFKGKSALRAEVAINIQKGNIAGINGPYPTGRWPDVKIFRHGLRHWLDEHERVEANDGYIGEARLKVKCPASFPSKQENVAVQQYARCRQETVNTRFKQWEILKTVFCHDVADHGEVFRAIVFLTQLALHNGEPLFSVEYKDP